MRASCLLSGAFAARCRSIACTMRPPSGLKWISASFHAPPACRVGRYRSPSSRSKYAPIGCSVSRFGSAHGCREPHQNHCSSFRDPSESPRDCTHHTTLAGSPCNAEVTAQHPDRHERGRSVSTRTKGHRIASTVTAAIGVTSVAAAIITSGILWKDSENASAAAAARRATVRLTPAPTPAPVPVPAPAVTTAPPAPSRRPPRRLLPRHRLPRLPRHPHPHRLPHRLPHPRRPPAAPSRLW